MNDVITLHTEGVIDGSHQLIGYDGQCSKVHGHSWHLKLWIRGRMTQVDRVGILFDFGRVKEIVDMFDHEFINDIPPFDSINPTAENLTYHIYTKLKAESPDLEFKVRVYETAVLKKTYAELGDWE